MAKVVQTIARVLVPPLLRAVDLVTRDYREHWSEISSGMFMSMSSARAALRGDLVQHFSAFWLEYSSYSAALYAIALFLGLTLLAPVSLLLLFLAPSLLLQVALVIPHVAYSVARWHHGTAFEAAFLDELKAVDPEYAAQFVRERGARPVSWGKAGTRPLYKEIAKPGILSRVLHTGAFTLRSLQYSVIGLVPVLGPLHTIARQGTLNVLAAGLGADLLAPWMEAQGWTAERQEEFVAQHKWILVGFALPYSLAGIIPFVGGLTAAVGQAACAHLVHALLAPTGDGRGPSTGSCAGQTSWEGPAHAQAETRASVRRPKEE